MTTGERLLDRMRQIGALKSGHFVLSSGRHSDAYVEKFDLLRQPVQTQAVCVEIADRFRDRRIDVVVGPTTGGVILAFEVGRQLGVGAAYAERTDDGEMTRKFRRGTTFNKDDRVVVVDDILTTGGSVRETVAALAEFPVEVIGAIVLVDRSGGNVDVGVRLDALATLEIATWDATDCPLCARGDAVTRPGTTTVP